MYEVDRAYRASEESARRLAEERDRMKEAAAMVRYGHSRSVLLGVFLRRLADQIDVSGRARAGRTSKKPRAPTSTADAGPL